MDATWSYDLIIFDCDGVLVDSELLSCGALIDCLQRHGIEMNLETFLDRFLGRTTQAVTEYCAALGRALPKDFQAELSARRRAAFRSGLRAVPGAAAVLENLNTPYCVASSSEFDRIDYSLQLTGLTRLVGERRFSAEMVIHGKPAPDLFLRAASGMGAAPPRTLVIEDSVIGVRAGKAAGMTVWGFVGGSHYADRDGRTLLLAAGADRVFDRMADFHPGEARRFDRAVR